MPQVSVIVSGFKRMTFLLSALESVLKQDSNRAFEILLMTRTPDLQIPTSFEKLAVDRGLKIRIIQIPEVPIGGSWAVAVREARGEFLSIIDDDDLWNAGKLLRLETAIDANPTLAYLHNSQTFVNEGNQPLSPFGLHRLVRHPESLIPEGRSVVIDTTQYQSILSGRSFRPEFNNSSITIRRSILTEAMSSLSRITRGEDTFLYYCGLSSRGKLYLTSDRFTRYRLHPGGATAVTDHAAVGHHEVRKETSADWFKPYLSFVEGHIQTLKIIQDEVARGAIPEVREWLDMDLSFWELIHSVVAEGTSRDGMLTLTRRVLGGAKARPRNIEVFAAMLGAISTISPSLTRDAFRAWRQAW